MLELATDRTLARVREIAELGEVLEHAALRWESLACTEPQKAVADVLRALVQVYTDTATWGDEAVEELRSVARKLTTMTHSAEAHRILARRAFDARCALEVRARREPRRDLPDTRRVDDLVRPVLLTLAQFPGAFPIDGEPDNEREEKVTEALRQCAENQTDPLGPVLRAWGCRQETIKLALENTRRDRKRFEEQWQKALSQEDDD